MMIFGGVFSELGDRRKARGKRYELEASLCAVVLSMLAGANSLRKIEAFIDERLEQLYPDHPLDLIEEHVIDWLEAEFAPPTYTRKQLDVRRTRSAHRGLGQGP